jgi:hypothetical protein
MGAVMTTAGGHGPLEKGKWAERIGRMREAGFTDEQAEVLFCIVDDVRGFNSATLSQRVRETWAQTTKEA